MTSFVKAFQHLGIDLVFFVDGPHGFNELQFEAKFSTLKDRYMSQLKDQYDSQQEYSMIKQSIDITTTPALLEIQWLMTLESAGMEIIYCLGEADQELALYARSHPEVCGILSSDSDFVVMEGSTLFPYNLLRFTHALMHDVDSIPADITCEAVSPSTIARALGIKEEQLPDLAILCGNDFTKPFNHQLKLKLKKALFLEATYVENVAKWLRGKEVPLINYRPFNAFCNNHPEYKNAVMYTYDFYSKDYSGLGVVSSKKSYTFFQAILLAVSECGIWWDECIPESLTLELPCVQELLLPLRKIVYFLLGMESVREFGCTQVDSFTEASICVPMHDESADLRCLHSSNFRDLGANEKLLSFHHLTVNTLSFGNHVEYIGKVPALVASECASLDLPECLSTKAIFVCSCLQLIAYLNQHSTPKLNLSQAELDALLVTCLACCIELELPHDSASLIPSVRSDTIESWFSRILLHAYLLATVLGLSDRLPQPKDLFSPMVFLLLHSVTQNSKHTKSNELIAMDTIWKKFMCLSAVTALSSAVFTCTAVDSPALRLDFKILHLFANALVEVACYRDSLTISKFKIVESPSECSSEYYSIQKPPMPRQRKRRRKHQRVTQFEDYYPNYNSLCAGNFTCKSCNKHFKEEQHYYDHHRKCYLCNFSACVKVLKKHEFRHTYSSVDVPDFSHSRKQISYGRRNTGHLKSYGTSNFIACREVVRIHRKPHCKISSGRNNGAENIASGKQSCEPCSRKGFKSERSYQAHLKSHIKCDICGLEACPKVLAEHKLAHAEPLEPDEAESNKLSHPPVCEPLAVSSVSKPCHFQPHVQPQETAYQENTAGTNAITSADLALAGATNHARSEGDAIAAVTDVPHEKEETQNDTESGSTSDLQDQSSSQKVQQPSHKYKPGSEMHMVEYFKEYVQENGGEVSITGLRKIAFQNYRKRYKGCPILDKNVFISHPQDFMVVEGAGFCTIKLEKRATAVEDLVIPITESSSSTCRLDTSSRSDDQKKCDLAPKQGSTESIQQDSVVCSPIFLESDGMRKSLDFAYKERTVPKAAAMLLGDPDLKSCHHSDPMKMNNGNVDSPSITADKPNLPRSESEYQEIPLYYLPDHDPPLADSPLSAVCTTSGAIGAVVVQNSKSKEVAQPSLAVGPPVKEGIQDNDNTQDDSPPGYQSSTQPAWQPLDDHKAAPGSDMHLVMYLKDYMKNNGGEASITSLRRIPFQSYHDKYSGPMYLSKALFKSYPEDFKVVEGAGFCRIKLLNHVNRGEEGPTSNPSNSHGDNAASIPGAGDEASGVISSIRDVSAQLEKEDASTTWITIPATVSKMHESDPSIDNSTGVMATEQSSVEVHEDSTTVTIVKQVVPTKHVQLQSSENETSTKYTQHQQHTPPHQSATTESGCESSDLTEKGTCTTTETKRTSDEANVRSVSGVKFVDGNEDTKKDASVDAKESDAQRSMQSGNTIQFVSVSHQSPQPGSKLHLVEFLRDFLEQNGGEARLGVLRKRAFNSYQWKYLQYSYLGKKFLRSYPEYFDIVDECNSCIVKLHKPMTPASDATTVNVHVAKPMPESLPGTAGKDGERDITYSEQVHIVGVEQFPSIAAAADCSGPTHSSCLSQLKSMGQKACTADIVNANPDESISNAQRETLRLDTSLESQVLLPPGSTEHIVKYFKEYLSAHRSEDGCHVGELMEVFDLKYKQEYALPSQPPKEKVNNEFFRTHSDVFTVSRCGIVRLREKNTFKPVSKQTDMLQLPLSKSDFLRADITSQPPNPLSGLPNRDLPKANDSLWPLKSKSAPKSALPKLEDVTSPLNSETDLPMRGVPKAIWPPKCRNSLPKTVSARANQVSKSSQKIGDESPKSSVSQTKSVSLKVAQPPNSKTGLPKADDALPLTRKTKSDLPQLKHVSQPQQSKSVQPQQSKSVQPQQSKSVQPQQSKSVQPQQSKSVQPQQSKSVQPQQSKSVQPQQSKSVQPQQSKSVQPQQSKSVQPQQSKSVQPQQSKSVQPQQSKSVQPQQSKSVQPQQSKSVQPQQSKSVQPQQSKSVQPQQSKSVQPQQSKSVQPQQSKSVQPQQSKSVQPQQSKSVQPEQSQSVQPQQSKSVQPQLSKSVQPQQSKSVQPQQSKSVQPQQSKSVQPQQSKSVQPQQSKSVQPQQSKSVQPQQSKSVQPQQSKSVQPQQSKSVQPQQSKSVQPEQSQSVQPQQSKSVQPQLSKSVQPQQSKSVQPEQSKSVQPQQSKSVQPQQSKSVQPQQSKSVQPQQSKSVQPQQSKSVQPEQSQSVQPQQSKSVQPQLSKSVQPQQSKSVQPQQSKSVQPQQSKSVQPQQSKSVQPQQSKSVQPEQSKSVQSKSVQPQQSKSVQPQQSKSVQPQQSKSVQSKSVQPQQSKSVQPQQSKSVQPQQSKSVQPQQSKSMQPQQSKSVQPQQSKSVQPQQSKSVQPQQSKSVQPQQSKSVQPQQSKSVQPQQSKSVQPQQSKSLQPQQSKSARDVQHSASSQVTSPHCKLHKNDPFTPKHVAEYFRNHLSRVGECSVEELKDIFERKYKRQNIMSSCAVITYVSENFFRRRSDLFEVTTNGTVKLKNSAIAR